MDILYQSLRKARPLGPINTYKFPMSLRRHYERMPNLPAGLVVMGDAACCFNPIYGQGMTVAALEAVALDRCLEQCAGQDLRGLPRHFQRALARVVDVPWSLAAGVDLGYPAVEGSRPPGSGIIGAYMNRLQTVSAHDTQVLRAFYRVCHMLDAPSALLRPGIAARVLLGGLRSGRPDTAAAGFLPQTPAHLPT